MGIYLNPGNQGFKRILETEYIDKTGMIRLLNSTIGTVKNLTCISRPRRFGKSYAAQMLCAYYDRSCDSEKLFSSLLIAEDESYQYHMNHYHVISLDISGFVSDAKQTGTDLKEIPEKITEALFYEVKNIYPDLQYTRTLSECFVELVNRTETKIIFIIDEWDALIREAASDQEAQDRYLNLLRNWFKNNNFTPYVVAAAYMTGILPIKKDGSQSAISDFQEYSMLEPQHFAEYVGFTEEEVRECCRRSGMKFDYMKKWYDGYTVGEIDSVYNPYSVMTALSTGKYRSYWKKTSAAETLMTYIDIDQDGLQADIARLIAGEKVEVSTDLFQNDTRSFTCKDDVLTLMIHLGYLTYKEVPGTYHGTEENMAGMAWIPNEEVKSEFEQIFRKAAHPCLVELIQKSDRLFQDTVAGNCDKVASALQEVHDSEYAPVYYNDEQSLRYVVKLAYISCIDQYAKVEELPSGRGIADVVFWPKRRSMLPAMIVELKWNKGTEGAIKQIKEHRYPEVLENFGGDILLVGITYNEKTKIHSCEIEFMHL